MPYTNTFSDYKKIIAYQRTNLWIRIAILILLVLIGARVLYNHYGVPPSLEDQKLMKEVFGENTPIIDCRGALVYYARSEGLISQSKANNLTTEFNISKYQLS